MPFEDTPRIVDRHRADLGLRNVHLAECRNHVRGNVSVVPVGGSGREIGLRGRKEIDVAASVVGEHELVGAAAPAAKATAGDARMAAIENRLTAIETRQQRQARIDETIAEFVLCLPAQISQVEKVRGKLRRALSE